MLLSYAVEFVLYLSLQFEKNENDQKEAVFVAHLNMISI